jgi:hypothetical protein
MAGNPVFSFDHAVHGNAAPETSRQIDEGKAFIYNQ